MYDKLLNGMYYLENHPVLSSIKKGFILIVPMLIIGSLALLLRNFPLPSIQIFFDSFAGGIIGRFLQIICDATLEFMSAYLVLGISFYYSSTFGNKNFMLQIMAMITSLVCFVASFGGVNGSLTLQCFGTTGVFTAMFSAIIATKLFLLLEKHFNRGFRAYAAGVDINYKNSIVAILPFFFCVLVFALVHLILTCFGINNFNELISGGLVKLFDTLDGELVNGLVFVLLLNFLWIFGMHGGNALDPVAQALFVPANTDPTAIISKSFLDNFVLMGGSGTAICLLLALLSVSRSADNRQLARSATPMVIFNINEILVFGLPIVLNPILMLPFIFVPLLSLLIAYGVTIMGWMPIVNETINWTTPILFSGYLASHSITGLMVQLVTVIVGTACYIPFVRFAESMQHGREPYLLEKLTEQFCQDEEAGLKPCYLCRSDNIGVIAKTMISQLRSDIQKQQVEMYYQPQMNAEGQIIGAEALLRWSFLGQKVYPPLVVALAREDGCFDDLTWGIINTVCSEVGYLCTNIHSELKISINIVAEQLNNAGFIDHVIDLANAQGICENLILEVTEETALGNYGRIAENIEHLRIHGIIMAIDDFSMGQTSLNYLKSNGFQLVKLDGALVKQVLHNSRCSEIIASIVNLGKNLGFEVTAEYVENQAIRDTMAALGCHAFQGYLYSPAVPKDDLIRYAQGLRKL